MLTKYFADNTDEEIAGHALSLFLEGFETSSTVFSFLLYELARNPDAQEKVYEEIIEVSKRHDNKFTFDALQDMTYLECALHGNYSIANEHFQLINYFRCYNLRVSTRNRITAP